MNSHASDACQPRIAAFLDEQSAAQTAFLAEMVKVPTDNPPGDCVAHASRTRALLEGLGLTVEADPVPAADAKACGMIAATNLIVRQSFGTPGAGGPTIALNAHGDVVPPGLGWTHDPYRADIVDDPVHGPTMVGRGVAVSKSDFATYTWALLALRKLAAEGVPLQGALELHFTYDEEAGGAIGPQRLLETGLSKPDYAISAGFSYAVTTAHNGCLHLEVIVRGKQAHAAMPHTGHDALEACTSVLQALYRFRTELAQRRSKVPGIDCATLNIGLIEGGINTNVVPDEVRLRIDRRMIPEEAGSDAQGELEAVVRAAVANLPGIRIETRRIMLAEPLTELPGAEHLAHALIRHAERVFGTAVAETGVPLYTDARHYCKAGVPTVLYGAGPRTLLEARGHAADECLRLSDLRRATEVVTCTLIDLLTTGYTPPPQGIKK